MVGNREGLAMVGDGVMGNEEWDGNWKHCSVKIGCVVKMKVMVEGWLIDEGLGR